MSSYNINGTALHPIHHIPYLYIDNHMTNRTVTGLMVFKEPIPECYLGMMKEQGLEDTFQLEEWWLGRALHSKLREYLKKRLARRYSAWLQR